MVSGGGHECEGRRTTYFLEVETLERERNGIRRIGPHECEDQPSERGDPGQNQRLNERLCWACEDLWPDSEKVY